MLIKIYQPISCCWSLSIPSNVLEVYKEAATGGALQKVFLKLSLISQKNICASVSFLIKLKA